MGSHQSSRENHQGPGGLLHRLRHLISHSHDPVTDSGLEGIHATKVSLLVLGATAAAQAVIVAFTGSVALLSDTLHNVADALTSVPLWIAFWLGRRPATRRFTYGYHRAEDVAGLLIVMAIAASAVAVAWESVQRLVDPRTIDHIPWVIAAGFIGALGNEAVARYRTRVGRRIGSEALIADGQHARVDALTSLAVVVAGVGAALGAPWVDPLAGLVVAGLILVLLRRSGARMLGRLLDAVDPELLEEIEHTANEVGQVREVSALRVRWHGHRLLVTLSVAVDPDLSVAEGHRIAQEVAHRLLHAFEHTAEVTVHIDPHGIEDSHSLTAHHRT